MMTKRPRRLRVLITAMSMEIGGAEKSLVSLLNLLDYSSVDVELLLFQRRGPLLAQIPDSVKIIRDPTIDLLFGIPPEDRVSVTRRLRTLGMRYVGTAASRLRERQFDRQRLKRWIGWYRDVIPSLSGEYDYAVSYSGGETFWYIVDRVSAKARAVYFHSDYSNIDIDVKGEARYLKSATKIVTISATCAESLRTLFPDLSERVVVIENPSSVEMIRTLSREPVEDGFRRQDGALRIVSVGRLHRVKGFDLAAEVAAQLQAVLPGRFEWIVVGDGPEHGRIAAFVKQRELEDSFRLVGERENPYPYIYTADIVVQPSRFEGKSVVLDEARILGKPVLVTAYPSASDQVRDGVDGRIVRCSVDALARGIAHLISHPEEVDTLTAGALQSTGSILNDVSGFMSMLLEGPLNDRGA